MNKIMIQIEPAINFDLLNILALEYSTSVEHLINIAVSRLISTIDFTRELREGKI
jgi:hypothetical protein